MCLTNQRTVILSLASLESTGKHNEPGGSVKMFGAVNAKFLSTPSTDMPSNFCFLV